MILINDMTANSFYETNSKFGFGSSYSDTNSYEIKVSYNSKTKMES